ncbi:MAG TPA: hypothetical protein VFZ48_02400 [Candidatus Saccharimonadales bacterium]
MTTRILHEGKHTTYEHLVGELEPGEGLMASYKKGAPRVTTVEPVANEATFNRIADGTFDHNEGTDFTGFDYFDLRWHASTTGSTRPADYGRAGF